MSHQIESMMYNSRSGAPWHGKGTPVNGLATTADCLARAQLDWRVEKVGLTLDQGERAGDEDLFAVVRTDRPAGDPRRVLGVVGQDYEVLQNHEAFAFFDGIAGAGAAIYETAGSIDGGRRVWLLARIPGTITPVPGDDVIPYLLLANGHDGHLMLRVKFTPVRVVCQNTLTAALCLDRSGFAIRHDRGMRDRMASAAVAIRSIYQTIRSTSELWQRMAEFRMDERAATRYFQEVFSGVEDDGAGELRWPEPLYELYLARQLRGLRELRGVRALRGLQQAAMQDAWSATTRRLGIDGTLWAAYNGATWAVDWQRKSRPDRVDDLVLGDGAQIKERALEVAERLVLAARRPSVRVGSRLDATGAGLAARPGMAGADAKGTPKRR